MNMKISALLKWLDEDVSNGLMEMKMSTRMLPNMRIKRTVIHLHGSKSPLGFIYLWLNSRKGLKVQEVLHPHQEKPPLNHHQNIPISEPRFGKVPPGLDVVTRQYAASCIIAVFRKTALGNKNNQQKKQKKAERTTGRRKTKKSPEPEVEKPTPPPSGPESAHHDPSTTGRDYEQQGIAALMSMGEKDSSCRQENWLEKIFAVAVPGVSADALREEREREQQEDAKEHSSVSNDEDLSGSQSDSDSAELGEGISILASTTLSTGTGDSVAFVSSPTKEAQRCKSKFKITFHVP
ncbi:hypothetical protein B0H10DRAFT_1957928 [Mycena sp. CBHHK59/15]|nr:hypothetical protein B0H10DRAFT_1957928 [Mycena sp. CBHHK59/15]